MHLSADKYTVWNVTESRASAAKTSFRQSNAKLTTTSGWFSMKFCVVFWNTFWRTCGHDEETNKKPRACVLERVGIREWSAFSTNGNVSALFIQLHILYHFDWVFMGCDVWWSWTLPATVHIWMWPVTWQEFVHSAQSSQKKKKTWQSWGCQRMVVIRRQKFPPSHSTHPEVKHSPQMKTLTNLHASKNNSDQIPDDC